MIRNSYTLLITHQKNFIKKLIHYITKPTIRVLYRIIIINQINLRHIL